MAEQDPTSPPGIDNVSTPGGASRMGGRLDIGGTAEEIVQLTESLTAFRNGMAGFESKSRTMLRSLEQITDRVTKLADATDRITGAAGGGSSVGAAKGANPPTVSGRPVGGQWAPPSGSGVGTPGRTANTSAPLGQTIISSAPPNGGSGNNVPGPPPRTRRNGGGGGGEEEERGGRSLSRAEMAVTGVALVANTAGRYVNNRDYARGMDYLYQQVSFSSSMDGGRGSRDDIRQALFSGGAAAGTLGGADYASSLMATRAGGAATQGTLASRAGASAFFASAAPGIGSMGGLEAQDALYNPRTFRVLRQLTGNNYNAMVTGGDRAGQARQIFGDVARRAGITDQRSLERAFTSGTAENTTIQAFTGGNAQLTSAFRETIENQFRPAADRTDNALSSMLERNESAVGRDLSVENGMVQALEQLDDTISTLNGLLRAAGTVGGGALGNLTGLGLGGVGGAAGPLVGAANGLFQGALYARMAGIDLPERLGGGGSGGGRVGSAVRSAGGAGAVLGRTAAGASVASAGLGLGNYLDHARDGEGGWREWLGNISGDAARGAGLGAGIGMFLGPQAAALGGIVGGLGGAVVGAARSAIGDPHAGHDHGGAKNSGGMDSRMSAALAAMMRDNPMLQVNSGHRSTREQAALYASGKSPVAPGGSKHEQGTAVDLGPSSQYGWLRMNAARYGLESITQSEPWHFELRGSRSPQDKASSINAEGAFGGGTEGTGAGAMITPNGVDSSEIPNFDKMTAAHAGQETMTVLAGYLRKRFGKDAAPITSGYRPGSRTREAGNLSNHATGRALDVSAPGHGNRGAGHPGLKAIYDHYMQISPLLRELILSGPDYDNRVDWVSQGSRYKPRGQGATWDDHWDHVHVSTHERSLPGVIVPGPEDSNEVTGGSNFAPKLTDTYGSIDQADLIQSLLSGGGTVMATATRSNSATGSGVSENLASASDIPGTILRVGKQLGANNQALLAALEAGYVESRWRTGEEVAYKDLDSIGVMQQRSAWAGEPKDIPFASSKRNDPAWAARAFFMGGEGGQPGAFAEQGNRSHTSAGHLAQDVQVSAYPGRYDDARDTAISMAAQYGIDLSGVGDPAVEIMSMAPPTVSMPMTGPMAGPMSGAGNHTMADMMGGGLSMSMNVPGGNRRSGGGVHIEELNMTVELPNGSRKEVEMLFENIRDHAQRVSSLQTLART